MGAETPRNLSFWHQFPSIPISVRFRVRQSRANLAIYLYLFISLLFYSSIIQLIVASFFVGLFVCLFFHIWRGGGKWKIGPEPTEGNLSFWHLLRSIQSFSRHGNLHWLVTNLSLSASISLLLSLSLILFRSVTSIIVLGWAKNIESRNKHTHTHT